MKPELALALADGGGVIARAANRDLASSLDWQVRTGKLVPLLPGTYGTGPGREQIVRSLFHWDPDAVIRGEMAASLTWWPDIPVGDIEATSRRRAPARVPMGISLSRGTVKPELVLEREWLRFAHPALSVLDLLPTLGGHAIDEALRRRATTLSALRWALKGSAHRAGNKERWRLLIESRDEPWSELERAAHVALRAAGIKGWRANHWIELPGGGVFVDICLPSAMLAVEIDGWGFHGDRESFHRDRARDVRLTLAGWTVLHFTSETLPTLVDSLKQALRR